MFKNLRELDAASVWSGTRDVFDQVAVHVDSTGDSREVVQHAIHQCPSS